MEKKLTKQAAQTEPKKKPAAKKAEPKKGVLLPKRAQVVGRVNMRSKPSVESEVLRILEIGTQLRIVPELDTEASEFYPVVFGKETGYVMKKFLELI